MKRVISKKIIIAGIGVLAVIGLVVAMIVQYNVARDLANAEHPEYETVLPAGKSIVNLGGWRRVSPPKSDPVFAYVDKIGDAPVNVSEQPLPKSFEGDIDNQIAELAKKYNATAEIDAGGTIVYVGTSAKGPQSVIFTMNNLLVLIKSQEKIPDEGWAAYVSSLN